MRISFLRRLGAGAGLAMMLAAVAHAAFPPQPAKVLDPERYSGRWYEVARLPNKIEADCVNTTVDWARQPNGQFNVVQTCHTNEPAKVKVWRASGRVVDPATNAKIRLSFFGGLVTQEYWVLDRGDDYSWCILTTPNPKWLWILFREPQVSPAQRNAVVARVKAMGFDVSHLVFDDPPG